MKFTASIALLIQATAILAAPQTCGELGVMEVPNGADASKYRACAGHPNGAPDTTINRRNDANVLTARRDCYSGGKEFGCDKNYCWKICGQGGSGQWCWTAFNGGNGQWKGCSADSQCAPADDGADCGVCGKDSCGCGC